MSIQYVSLKLWLRNLNLIYNVAEHLIFTIHIYRWKNWIERCFYSFLTICGPFLESITSVSRYLHPFKLVDEEMSYIDGIFVNRVSMDVECKIDIQSMTLHIFISQSIIELWFVLGNRKIPEIWDRYRILHVWLKECCDLWALRIMIYPVMSNHLLIHINGIFH